MRTTIKPTMLGAFRTLITCCVFSSAAFAQQTQSRPNPARASTTAAWEYGELFYVGLNLLAAGAASMRALTAAGVPLDAVIQGNPDKKALGPIWLSADTSLFRMLDSVAAQPNPPGRVGGVTLIRLLNALGTKGWELINVPSNPGEPYLFKRQLTPNQ